MHVWHETFLWHITHLSKFDTTWKAKIVYSSDHLHCLWTLGRRKIIQNNAFNTRKIRSADIIPGVKQSNVFRPKFPSPLLKILAVISFDMLSWGKEFIWFYYWLFAAFSIILTLPNSLKQWRWSILSKLYVLPNMPQLLTGVSIMWAITLGRGK